MTARDIAIAERVGVEFYIDSFLANIAKKNNNVLAEYTTEKVQILKRQSSTVEITLKKRSVDLDQL